MAGIVVLLEDKENIRDNFHQTFQDHGIRAELKSCSSPKEYESILTDESAKESLKALIMDLSNTPEEVDSKSYKAAEYIREQYNENRIPIFIHSGNLQYYDEMNDQGTVFKIEKGKTSITRICSSIQLMEESGFLDLFTYGGKIEAELMSELHEAFISQFKNKEIEDILNSIRSSANDENIYQERTAEVFKRIAVRSVYENLVNSKEGTDEIKLNAIEHYYRRTDARPFWTGDIFMRSDDSSHILILTPRCNIENDNFEGILVCTIHPFSQERINQLTSKRGPENLRRNITDDEKLVGDRYRFLPPTPQFIGGIVDFISVFSISVDRLSTEYSRIITVSDELTNDVVRKLSNYIQRGGISNTEYKEAHYYVQELLNG